MPNWKQGKDLEGNYLPVKQTCKDVPDDSMFHNPKLEELKLRAAHDAWLRNHR